MNDLIVTLIQSDLHWEDRTANLAMFEEKLSELENRQDVIVLPEMFSTGYSMNAAVLAETMNLQTTRWMQQMAEKSNALILGSFIAKEGSKFFNRLVWAEPGGRMFTYDKRHTFRMAKEHETYASGTSRLIETWRGWRICPMVCYDLRFPVWSRNTPGADGKPGYDLLLYVASWPSARIFAWDTLLKARAIENLSFVAGVNRTGPDGRQMAYNGHSAIIDPLGNTLAEGGEGEGNIQATLRAEALLEHRQKFPAYLDADSFRLE